MTRLRRALPAIASAWLLCQSAALTAVPALFWETSVEDLLECTCGHGEHAICPMHHKPARDSRRCTLSSTHDTDTGMLASVLVGPALMPTVRPLHFLGSPAVARAIVASQPTLRPAPPDPPPPRA